MEKANKQKLIESILQNSTYSRDDIESAVNIYFDKITLSLLNEDRVEIRDFASFSIRTRLVPQTPQIDDKSEKASRVSKKSIYFRTAKNLNIKINN